VQVKSSNGALKQIFAPSFIVHGLPCGKPCALFRQEADSSRISSVIDVRSGCRSVRISMPFLSLNINLSATG